MPTLPARADRRGSAAECASARRSPRRVTLALLATVLATLVACGGESATAPPPPPQPAPTIVEISPHEGAITGGTFVTITGSGFQYGAAVAVDGVAATNVRVLSGSAITAITPPGRALGAVGVVVTNAGGRSVEWPAGFRYMPAGDDDGCAGCWDY